MAAHVSQSTSCALGSSVGQSLDDLPPYPMRPAGGYGSVQVVAGLIPRENLTPREMAEVDYVRAHAALRAAGERLKAFL